MPEETATTDARPVDVLTEQHMVLGALRSGARLMRHRGPIGKPTPYWFTLHHDTDEDAAGRPVTPACVRGLYQAKMIDVGPWPGDMLAPRPLLITKLGASAHDALLAYDVVDTADTLDINALLADACAVIDAMAAGQALHRHDDGTFTLSGGAAVAIAAGHALVTVGCATRADTDADVEAFTLAEPGRAGAVS